MPDYSVAWEADIYNKEDPLDAVRAAATEIFGHRDNNNCFEGCFEVTDLDTGDMYEVQLGTERVRKLGGKYYHG